MTKEMRELLAKREELEEKSKKSEERYNEFKREGNKNEAVKTMDEWEDITREQDLLEREIKQLKKKEEKEERDFQYPSQEDRGKGNREVEYNGELFTRAIADSLLKERNLPGKNFTEAERRKISEHVDEDGGYAVPIDISVKINKRLKDETDIHTLVDSEKVYTRSGARTYSQRSNQSSQLVNLDEYETIEKIKGPKLERIKFNLHNFAGMIEIPNDLLQFAAKELEDYIIDWLVDEVRKARNEKILYGKGGSNDPQGIMTSNKYTQYNLPKDAGLKDFKKLVNVELMNVFKPTAKWIVNQDGFNYLDSLEDKTGRPYLQIDPRDATQHRFLGLPVVEIPNVVLKTEDGKIPVILGDLQEAYKIFYDGHYSLLATNIGAGAFETNTTITRVITKLDGCEKDPDAIIICNLPGEAEATPDKTK